MSDLRLPWMRNFTSLFDSLWELVFAQVASKLHSSRNAPWLLTPQTSSYQTHKIAWKPPLCCYCLRSKAQLQTWQVRKACCLARDWVLGPMLLAKNKWCPPAFWPLASLRCLHTSVLLDALCSQNALSWLIKVTVHVITFAWLLIFLLVQGKPSISWLDRATCRHFH